MPLRFLTSGESHGPAMVAVLEGFPAGLSLPTSAIDDELARRQSGYGSGPRMKIEDDKVQILSGVMDGVTTGAPISLLIQNNDHKNWQGKPISPLSTPRPGHADLTAALKYGYGDFRLSLERASARETATRVAIGAICKRFLNFFGIQIGGYVSSIGGLYADVTAIPIPDRFTLAEQNETRCPDSTAATRFQQRIREAMTQKDTLGGIIEIIAIGLPPGLGSHVHADRRLTAKIGAAVLGVQAMKGIEIGPAFENTGLTGTQTQDAILLQDQELVRPTNRAGGIEGGITNGQPLLVRAAMKPIASTLTPQPTVDLATGQQTTTQYERSDFCPVPRAVPVLEAVIAFVLADALLEKLGGDSIEEITPRFAALKKSQISDLNIETDAHTWWPD
ncbi:MAG: chorismate synthase [Anaerolineae bacterium]|nr:chorismate synthase [Anaerolineae bacterium]